MDKLKYLISHQHCQMIKNPVSVGKFSDISVKCLLYSLKKTESKTLMFKRSKLLDVAVCKKKGIQTKFFLVLSKPLCHVKHRL